MQAQVHAEKSLMSPWSRYPSAAVCWAQGVMCFGPRALGEKTGQNVWLHGAIRYRHVFFFEGDSPVCIYMIKNSAVLGLRKVMGSLSLEILKLSDIDLL